MKLQINSVNTSYNYTENEETGETERETGRTKVYYSIRMNKNGINERTSGDAELSAEEIKGVEGVEDIEKIIQEKRSAE